MANWKRVHNFEDIVDELVLLREDFTFSSHTSYYAGVIRKDTNNGYYIQTSESKVGILHEEETYHYIPINEILF